MATTSTPEALFEENRKKSSHWMLGAFVRRQITHVFLFGSGFLFRPIKKRSALFISRPHSGLDRRAALAMITGLLVPGGSCTCRGMCPATLYRAQTAALGIFARFQIAHLNFGFVFLLFAHITFLQLFFWFWVV
jgi:hypothetical protein